MRAKTVICRYYTICWGEYFHKLYNFQIRGEIVENMIDEIENLKYMIHVNEKKIKDLKSKCEKCEQSCKHIEELENFLLS